MTLLLILIAALFATLNAIVCGYYLMQLMAHERGSEAYKGSLIFASLAGTTALFLFTLAALHP